MRKNKLKELFKAGKPIINSWLAIPSSFSAEVMANQGWDSITIDMQHGLIDYPNAVEIFLDAKITGKFHGTSAATTPTG